MSLNSGLYIREAKGIGYKIDKGMNTGIGLNVNYYVTKTTKLGTGVLYNYVKTFETTYYFPEPTKPILHTIEIPFQVQQQVYKNWVADIGVSSLIHTNNIVSQNGKNGVFGRWNLGGGLRFEKLAVSIHYAENFKSRTIIIESANSNNISFSEYKRKVLYVKLEYPLWNF